MKSTVAEITPRLAVSENKQQGIQNYGDQNSYPQTMRNAVKSSGRAMQCTNLVAKFIRGLGCAIPFYKTVVNKKKLTVDKLHRKLVADYALYKGFAMHVNYNMLGEIVSLDHIPFEELRLGIEDEQGIVSTVKHHPDWAKESSRYFQKDKITEMFLFNPVPEVILAQAEKSGGFANYKGQVYWYSDNGDKYPEAYCDPILEDVVSDHEAKQFRLNNLTTNFMASHIMEVPKFEDEDDRTDFIKNLKTFQGSKSAAKIFLLEKETEEATFDLKKVDIQDMDGLFKETESSTLESIRRMYMVLPVLLGDLIAGKLATASEIADAYAFTNSITSDERLIFEEVFTEIFGLWHDKNINPSKDYSIKELSYGQGLTPEPATPAPTPQPQPVA